MSSRGCADGGQINILPESVIKAIKMGVGEDVPKSDIDLQRNGSSGWKKMWNYSRVGMNEGETYEKG